MIIDTIVREGIGYLALAKSGVAEEISMASAYCLASTLAQIADDNRHTHIASDIAVSVADVGSEFDQGLNDEFAVMIDHERVTAWYRQVGLGLN